MNKKMLRRLIISLIAIIIVVVAAISITQYFILQKAETSFDSYYKYRGCAELISKSSTSAVCNLASGETIKIVEHGKKWTQDNSIPTAPRTL